MLSAVKCNNCQWQINNFKVFRKAERGY